jgi:cardiolipin synthase
MNASLSEAFENDLQKSTKLTLETFNNMSLWIRFKQKISRLFSPIM